MIRGRYRWGSHSPGPAPIFGLVLRPKQQGWVRFEIIILGRAFYLHWGKP